MEAIGLQAYRLRIPATLKIHPVFYVSLLEPARSRAGDKQPPPLPIEVDGVEEDEVATILDSRLRNGRLQYLVRGAGYNDSKDS